MWQKHVGELTIKSTCGIEKTTILLRKVDIFIYQKKYQIDFLPRLLQANNIRVTKMTFSVGLCETIVFSFFI